MVVLLMSFLVCGCVYHWRGWPLRLMRLAMINSGAGVETVKSSTNFIYLYQHKHIQPYTPSHPPQPTANCTTPPNTPSPSPKRNVNPASPARAPLAHPRAPRRAARTLRQRRSSRREPILRRCTHRRAQARRAEKEPARACRRGRHRHGPHGGAVRLQDGQRRPLAETHAR